METRTIIPIRIIFALLCMPGVAAFGQAVITGEVTNALGDPVASASVTIRGKGVGVTADSLGKFSISTSLKGTQTLQVSSVGFKTYQQKIVLSDSAITVSIALQDNTNTLEEVTVNAGSFEASDKAKGASLTPIDAYTVAGNGGDISNALRSLPGSQQVGEREGLFVRGGTNDETKMFVDGTLMKNPNYASLPGIMQPARVNLFLFKGVLFNTGGYSALYGQAMSSALILESIDLPEKSSASFSVFPSNLGAGFQQLSKSNRSSYGGGISYSNLHPYNSIIPQKPDYYRGPEYVSGYANLRFKTGKTGMVKGYVAYTNSAIGMRNPDVDSLPLTSDFKLNNRNIYATLTYRGNLNDNWVIDAGAAYTFDRNNTETRLTDGENNLVTLPRFPFDNKNANSRTISDFAQARTVLTRHFGGNQALRFGGEQLYFRDNLTYNDTGKILDDHFSAAFAEADFRISENVAAKLGTRLEYSTLLKKASLAPRLSLAYRVRNGEQFNLAYGIFYQKPENIYLFRNNKLDFSNATHYVLNYSKRAGNRFFRTEIYYKKYRNLIRTNPEIGKEGTGYAKGIELFWRDKKTIKNLDYWLTYTYLDTKRNYLNYPESLRPSFTTPHTFTVAIKRYFENLNISVNVAYSYASGRPYYDIRPGFSSPDSDEATKIYDSGQANPYSALNLHVAHLMKFLKKSKVKDVSGIAFGVNNLLGTRQVFGYNYSYNGQYKTPVTLPATRTYFIGFFMSLGIDRTNDILDNL